MRNFIHLCTLLVVDQVVGSSTPPHSFQPISSRSSSSPYLDPDDLPFAFPPAFTLEGLTISDMFEQTSLESTTTTTTTVVPPISIDVLLRAQQFEEAIELVTPNLLARSTTDIFTETERNRIMEIFKGAIDHEREKYRDITRAMTVSSTRGETYDGGRGYPRFAEYPDTVLRDIAGRAIRRYCTILIQIFSNQVSVMDQMFYAVHRANLQALMGDLYRYISEVTSGDDKRLAQELGLSLYSDALHVYYQIGLPVEDPERLRVQTNRELLLWTIPALRRDAVYSLAETVRELEREFNRRRMGSVSREESDFVNVLRARLKYWKEQLQEEEWVVVYVN